MARCPSGRSRLCRARRRCFRGYQVQAPGGGVRELVVAIECVALGLVRTPGEAAIEAVAQVCFFAHQVDGAAGRATPANGRVRAFAHFDRFHGEDLAALRAGVAHAVQVGVALGVKTTDERAVALGVAAFAGAEGDARHGAQGVLHRQRAGVLEHLLRDHRDRARRVHQWRGVFGRRSLLHLVGGWLLEFTHHRGGVQRDGVARRLFIGLFGGVGHVGRGCGGERHANGRSE